MVDVELIGGLGNNMFQYALGRIIADSKGYNLDTTNLDQLGQALRDEVTQLKKEEAKA